MSRAGAQKDLARIANSHRKSRVRAKLRLSRKPQQRERLGWSLALPAETAFEKSRARANLLSDANP